MANRMKVLAAVVALVVAAGCGLTAAAFCDLSEAEFEREVAAVVRDAGDVAISAMEGTVRVPADSF